MNLIRKAIHEWKSWRTRRRIYRACPEMALIDQAQKEARKSHRPSKHFYEAKRALMMAMLNGER